MKNQQLQVLFFREKLPTSPRSINPPNLYFSCNPCSFSFLYFNARSVLPKLDELRALCKTHKPTIVCIVESWLDSTIENNEIGIENYAIVRADRNRHGGGVLLYVIESLSFNVIFSRVF